MTPQGKAIKEAAVKFGDGKTLPFAPCKRGYIPVILGNNKNNKHETEYFVACSFHEKARRKRLAREKGKLRGGEADPKTLFWDKVEKDLDTFKDDDSEPNEKTLSEKESSSAKALAT
eukprot:CAMPEP_0116133514 /NCGR_PEP_ID=MMETSP0329-20121206/10147_1 /TAXON_ID=697910 /ORGANISM="Pseudo-nitzschia arenysensis, Strain B593" /LENGTH=116 /DNA_ID=CAMNT_0003628151 /DNA_START=231 /DNA_END=581 /DNA_ORIENTATION=+